ncbi:hypothetical protein V6N13_010508 [Hibiscus sabdariffa]|uniref:Uncharacterized protein n=2 Tax=Hibiscus sabdariffa TaxID=183260 RepID=A0ABR2NVY4_9ROSI
MTKSDSVPWRAMIGGYLRMLPDICAKMSHWEKKTKSGEVMDRRKIPGRTSIELINNIYISVAGDMYHNQHKEAFDIDEEDIGNGKTFTMLK